MLIQILNCSGNITSCCTSSEISYIMVALRRVYTLIQIIVPILLMISLVIKFIHLAHNPEDKKTPKQIVNAALAAVIVFFLPTIVSALLNMLPEQIQLTACWLSAEDTYKFSKKSTYQTITDDNKKKILLEEEYEKGEKRPSPSPSSSSTSSSQSTEYETTGTESTPGSLTNVNYNQGGMPIPIYYQGDYRNVILKPGTDRSVATSGCGFTSISMITSYLLNKKITPKELVGDWSRKYYIYNQGMAYSGFQGAADH